MKTVLTGLVLSLAAYGQCYEAQRLNYVRERLASASSDQELREIYSYVKTATGSCFTSGDLWHFRSVLEQKLGIADAPRSESKAVQFHSAAKRANINPLAVPEKPAGSSPLPSYVRQKWALVVGIGEFADASIPRLRFTVNDAKKFAETLTDPKAGRFAAGNVRLLTDQQATVQGIRDGIGWLRANAKEDDLVVIYIASHGSPRTLDPRGVSYIITHETQLGDKLYSTSYQMVDLVQHMNRDLGARRVVLILDACHSGGATQTDSGQPIARARALVAKGAASYNDAFAALRTGTGWAVMTSSRSDERSWESEKIGNGYFTYYLVEALKEKDGLATLKEVFEQVRSRVAAAVRDQVKEEQNPVFDSATEGGDLVLGVAPKS